MHWLNGAGLTSDRAWSISKRITDALLADWGGQQIYIPAGHRAAAAARAAQIRERFSGNNHRELAREYGLPERRIRQILKPLEGKS